MNRQKGWANELLRGSSHRGQGGGSEVPQQSSQGMQGSHNTLGNGLLGAWMSYSQRLGSQRMWRARINDFDLLSACVAIRRSDLGLCGQ